MSDCSHHSVSIPGRSAMRTLIGMCVNWTAVRAFPTTPRREKDQRHLEDCAAGRDFHSGHTPRIQHYESLAVSTAQNPRGLGQRGDDVVDDLGFSARIAILVRDINAVTAVEPDTKHNRFHVPHTRRACHQPRSDSFSSVRRGSPRLKTLGSCPSNDRATA